MSLPKAVIKVNGAHGRRTEISIDGVPLEQSISRAVLTIDVSDVNRLEVEHLIEIDEIEVQGIVLYRAVAMLHGTPYKGYLAGEGGSPREAFAALLAKLP